MPSALLLHPNSDSGDGVYAIVQSEEIAKSQAFGSTRLRYLNFALPGADAEHDKLDRQVPN